MTDMPTNSLCDLEKLLLFTVKKKKKGADEYRLYLINQCLHVSEIYSWRVFTPKKSQRRAN